jgi:hypothetical protein
MKTDRIKILEKHTGGLYTPSGENAFGPKTFCREYALKAMQEYADLQLSEYKRKFKLELECILEEHSKLGAWNEGYVVGTEEVIKLIDNLNA